MAYKYHVSAFDSKFGWTEKSGTADTWADAFRQADRDAQYIIDGDGFNPSVMNVCVLPEK